MSKPSTKWTSDKGDSPPPEISAESVRGKALALLTRREHSRAELSTKLVEFGADKALIETILQELIERGLQDDGRFAEAFVRSRSQRGYGPVVITHELRQRGVAPELAEAALEALDWQQQAIQVRIRRFGSDLPGDRKEQARQLRFLQYRGFPSAQALKAIKSTDEDWMAD